MSIKIQSTRLKILIRNSCMVNFKSAFNRAQAQTEAHKNEHTRFLSRTKHKNKRKHKPG